MDWKAYLLSAGILLGFASLAGILIGVLIRSLRSLKFYPQITEQLLDQLQPLLQEGALRLERKFWTSVTLSGAIEGLPVLLKITGGGAVEMANWYLYLETEMTAISPGRLALAQKKLNSFFPAEERIEIRFHKKKVYYSLNVGFLKKIFPFG